MPGSGARAFRAHAWAFIIGNISLSVANWLTGRPWWAVWPLLVWGVVLGVHYLVHKTRTVDDEWVAERTAELHAKSYDASHIDSIADRATEGELTPRARGGASPRE